MPLSEEEQRILSEIENQLRASDPDLARQVGSTTVYSDSLTKIKWGVVAFVAGLALTILLLTVNWMLAFLGFIAMMGAAVFIEANARRMGRAGIAEVTRSIRNGGLRETFNDASARTRRRLQRDDEA